MWVQAPAAWGGGLGGGPQGLTLGAVLAVVSARPGGTLGDTGAVVPGPALGAVPRAQAGLEVGEDVVV